MGRHAVQRPRAVLSLVAAGSAAALLAGVLTINGAATADQRRLSDNLVSNPDFESGTQGWNAQAVSTALVSAAGHDSRRAAQVTALNDGAILLLNDSPNVVQDATPGATYVASAWVRTDTPKMTVSLRFREVDGAALVGRAQTSVVLAGSGWQQISGEYVVAGANHQLAVQVLSTGARKGAALSVDDVDVREVLDSGGASATPPVESPKESPTPTESVSPTPDPTPSESTKPAPTPVDPTPTPKPTPSDPPASGPTSTVFGETMWMNPGESWAQTFNRLEGDYGRIDMFRAFLQAPPSTWSGYLSLGPRPMNVSFKALPKDVLAGKHDAALTAWFRSAPTDRPIWWTYYHEPEDNIANGEFTAADYRAAWKHLVEIADANAPKNLKSALVLMDWSLFPNSGRNWKDYYPGAAYIDLLGWDSYNSHGPNPLATSPRGELRARSQGVEG